MKILSKIFLVIVGLCLIGNLYYLYQKDSKTLVKETVVEKIDTIKDTVPVIKTEYLVSTLTETLYHIDTIVKGDTIIVDSVPVDVQVPITQKTYSDDSTYTAWVSGYQSKLDSIEVYKKTITITREFVKKNNKKFSIGPSINAGYDPSHKQFGWMIGFGVNYSLINF